jgi:glyoxylase I family protein
MQEQSRHPLRSPMPRGVHHLALCTDDMKATIEFYVDVLGMPLVHAMKVPPGLGTGPANRSNPPYEEVRHYFFDMGNDSLLAFFEIPKGKEPAGNRNAIGAMQNCASERFREVEARLKSQGIEYIGGIAQLPGLLGIYFYDPNGIRLEFACQPEDSRFLPSYGVSLRRKQKRGLSSKPYRVLPLNGSNSASPPCRTDRAECVSAYSVKFWRRLRRWAGFLAMPQN